MIWTKGAHQSAKFWTFNYPRKILTNIYFNGSFCWKYIKFSLKNYRGVVSWLWRLMQNLKKNWSVPSKMTRKNWWIFTQALEVLKSLHFHWFLLYRVFNVLPKKVQRSYLSGHWRYAKFDLWLGKWHEKYNTFSPDQLKVSKLGLWWDP